MYDIETIRAIQDMKTLADIIRKGKLDQQSTELDKVKYFDMFLRGCFGQAMPIYREQKDIIVQAMRYMQDDPHANRDMQALMQSISLNL